MSILFSPNGSLNVAADPSDLPDSINGSDILSGAMVRCKNLRLNEMGKARTRDGSAKINSSAIDTPIWWMEEQGGVRFSFAGASIYSNESSIASRLTRAQWAAIKYNAFNDTVQNIFALNGTDRKRIQNGAVHEWGIEAPATAPTLSSGNGSGLTGEYNAQYTYVRKVGSVVVAESNPSPAAAATKVLVNSSLAVDVTQPTDSQVTHIRLYRTAANSDVYSYDQELAVNTAYTFGYCFSWETSELSGTGFKFTTSDATHSTENTFAWEERSRELGTAVSSATYSNPFSTFDSAVPDADFGDLLATDHDRPPLGSFVFGPAYDGTCFIIKDNLLYYCKPKQPEYWPATYYLEVSTPQFPGKAGCFHNGQPYFLTSSEIYYIQGTGHGAFFPLPMRAKTGAQGARGVLSIAGKGLFHTGPDGVYLFSNGSDNKITEDALEPLFRGESVQGMPGVADMSTSWLWFFKNHLYFGYRGSIDSYPTNVLKINLETSRIEYYVYNDGANVEISAITTDDRNKRLLVGDSTGYIRVLESASYTDDSGTDISFEIQSKDYLLQTRKHFPRWSKYDIDASGALSCTGSLILDGEIHHSHAITGNRDTRRRLVEVGNGNRAAIRISGRGTVSIYSVESE